MWANSPSKAIARKDSWQGVPRLLVKQPYDPRPQSHSNPLPMGKLAHARDPGNYPACPCPYVENRLVPKRLAKQHLPGNAMPVETDLEFFRSNTEQDATAAKAPGFWRKRFCQFTLEQVHSRTSRELRDKYIRRFLVNLHGGSRLHDAALAEHTDSLP